MWLINKAIGIMFHLGMRMNQEIRAREGPDTQSNWSSQCQSSLFFPLVWPITLGSVLTCDHNANQVKRNKQKQTNKSNNQTNHTKTKAQTKPHKNERQSDIFIRPAQLKGCCLLHHWTDWRSGQTILCKPCMCGRVGPSCCLEATKPVVGHPRWQSRHREQFYWYSLSALLAVIS